MKTSRAGGASSGGSSRNSSGGSYSRRSASSATMRRNLRASTASYDQVAELSEEPGFESEKLVSVKMEGLVITDLMYQLHRRSAKLVDTHVICSDGYIPVHRCVLMAASTFLAELLMKEDPAEMASVCLPDFTVRQVLPLISSFYTGSTVFNKCELNTTLEIINLLQADGKNTYSFQPARAPDQKWTPRMRHYQSHFVQNHDDEDEEEDDEDAERLSPPLGTLSRKERVVQFCLDQTTSDSPPMLIPEEMPPERISGPGRSEKSSCSRPRPLDGYGVDQSSPNAVEESNSPQGFQVDIEEVDPERPLSEGSDDSDVEFIEQVVQDAGVAARVSPPEDSSNEDHFDDYVFSPTSLDLANNLIVRADAAGRDSIEAQDEIPDEEEIGDEEDRDPLELESLVYDEGFAEPSEEIRKRSSGTFRTIAFDEDGQHIQLAQIITEPLPLLPPPAPPSRAPGRPRKSAGRKSRRSRKGRKQQPRGKQSVQSKSLLLQPPPPPPLAIATSEKSSGERSFGLRSFLVEGERRRRKEDIRFSNMLAQDIQRSLASVLEGSTASGGGLTSEPKSPTILADFPSATATSEASAQLCLNKSSSHTMQDTNSGGAEMVGKRNNDDSTARIPEPPQIDTVQTGEEASILAGKSTSNAGDSSNEDFVRTLFEAEVKNVEEMLRAEAAERRRLDEENNRKQEADDGQRGMDAEAAPHNKVEKNRNCSEGAEAKRGISRETEEAPREREAQDVSKAKEADEARKAKEQEEEEETRRLRDAEEARRAKKEEEAPRAKEEEEARKAKEEEEARRVNEEEERRKAKEEEEAHRAREYEEEAARRAKKVEEARKAKEAEEARRAKKLEEARRAKEAEEARRAKVAEEARRAKEAEDARKAREAEEARKAREAEEARKAREAEEARRAAEEVRVAKEAEEARRAKEAEEARRAKEAEETRKVKEAEEARRAKETEEARNDKEADEVRKSKEGAAARKATEGDERRKQDDDAHKIAELARIVNETEEALRIEEPKRAEVVTEPSNEKLATETSERRSSRSAEQRPSVVVQISEVDVRKLLEKRKTSESENESIEPSKRTREDPRVLHSAVETRAVESVRRSRPSRWDCVKRPELTEPRKLDDEPRIVEPQISRQRDDEKRKAAEEERKRLAAEEKRRILEEEKRRIAEEEKRRILEEEKRRATDEELHKRREEKNRTPEDDRRRRDYDRRRQDDDDRRRRSDDDDRRRRSDEDKRRPEEDNRRRRKDDDRAQVEKERRRREERRREEEKRREEERRQQEKHKQRLRAEEEKRAQLAREEEARRLKQQEERRLKQIEEQRRLKQQEEERRLKQLEEERRLKKLEEDRRAKEMEQEIAKQKEEQRLKEEAERRAAMSEEDLKREAERKAREQEEQRLKEEQEQKRIEEELNMAIEFDMRRCAAPGQPTPPVTTVTPDRPQRPRSSFFDDFYAKRQKKLAEEQRQREANEAALRDKNQKHSEKPADPTTSSARSQPHPPELPVKAPKSSQSAPDTSCADGLDPAGTVSEPTFEIVDDIPLAAHEIELTDDSAFTPHNGSGQEIDEVVTQDVPEVMAEETVAVETDDLLVVPVPDDLPPTPTPMVDVSEEFEVQAPIELVTISTTQQNSEMGSASPAQERKSKKKRIKVREKHTQVKPQNLIPLRRSSRSSSTGHPDNGESLPLRVAAKTLARYPRRRVRTEVGGRKYTLQNPKIVLARLSGPLYKKYRYRLDEFRRSRLERSDTPPPTLTKISGSPPSSSTSAVSSSSSSSGSSKARAHWTVVKESSTLKTIIRSQQSPQHQPDSKPDGPPLLEPQLGSSKLKPQRVRRPDQSKLPASTATGMNAKELYRYQQDLRRCRHCKSKYRSHTKAGKCLLSHGLRRCFICLDLVSSLDSSYENHYARHHHHPKRGYVTCPVCHQLVNIRGLPSHISRKHLQTGVPVCKQAAPQRTKSTSSGEHHLPEHKVAAADQQESCGISAVAAAAAAAAAVAPGNPTPVTLQPARVISGGSQPPQAQSVPASAYLNRSIRLSESDDEDDDAGESPRRISPVIVAPQSNGVLREPPQQLRDKKNVDFAALYGFKEITPKEPPNEFLPPAAGTLVDVDLAVRAIQAAEPIRQDPPLVSTEDQSIPSSQLTIQRMSVLANEAMLDHPPPPQHPIPLHAPQQQHPPQQHPHQQQHSAQQPIQMTMPVAPPPPPPVVRRQPEPTQPKKRILHHFNEPGMDYRSRTSQPVNPDVHRIALNAHYYPPPPPMHYGGLSDWTGRMGMNHGGQTYPNPHQHMPHLHPHHHSHHLHTQVPPPPQQQQQQQQHQQGQQPEDFPIMSNPDITMDESGSLLRELRPVNYTSSPIPLQNAYGESSSGPKAVPAADYYEPSMTPRPSVFSPPPTSSMANASSYTDLSDGMRRQQHAQSQSTHHHLQVSPQQHQHQSHLGGDLWESHHHHQQQQQQTDSVLASLGSMDYLKSMDGMEADDELLSRCNRCNKAFYYNDDLANHNCQGGYNLSPSGSCQRGQF